ncbi:MAG TPA: hypothetical protein VMV18_03275, partial [bacterium]|nr:hypothetical protein [bacterium]
NPGACFVREVRAARDGGMHLTEVEGGKGRLVLVFETAGNARELTLTADPKTSKLLGCATLPRAATGGALKFRAETAIVESAAKSEPSALKFGGPAGLADLVTLQFKDGTWLALRPGASDPLASQSANTPQ